MISERLIRVDAESPGSGQERFDCHLGFNTRQRCPDTEMDAPPEADVIAGVGPVEAYLLGVLVDRVVTVRRWPDQHYMRAGGQRFVCELGVRVTTR